MFYKAPYSLLFVFTLLVMQFSHSEVVTPFASVETARTLRHADSLYASAAYGQAAVIYGDLITQFSEKSDLNTHFRYAYAAFRSGDFRTSASNFKILAGRYRFLPEFSNYFYIRSLWFIDSVEALNQSLAYIKKYENHPFSDSLLVPVAERLAKEQDYLRARRYYLRAKKQGVNSARNAEFLIRAARMLDHSGNHSQAASAFYQVIRKYPRDAQTLKLVNELKINQPDFFKKYFFKIINVYTGNRRFSEARRLLEQFIKNEPEKSKQEKARYYLLKLYYTEGRYGTALYGFRNLLATLNNKSLEPHIRLYLARIQRNMGNKRQAIKDYLDYADRYPRRRISPEAVWKSAWLYEELNEPETAIKLYRELRSRWKRSRYAAEAYFREGFTLYRLGRYEEADHVFTNIRFKKWRDMHVNRAQYWSALCRRITGDTITARRLQLDLAQELWDDYYTMKSYLLNKAHIDSSWEMIREFKNSPNPLTYYANGLTNLLDQFETAFQVRDLLGEKYAFLILSNIKHAAQKREEWIALAEIYKKFGAYGKAFRVYDYINNKYYSDKSYTEKSFILKERFPYYYDTIVDHYCNRYGLEPELVLGLIKQESVYDARAKSWADAYGLMQLIPPTARELARIAGVRLKSNKQLYDPELNIHLGTLYLKQLNRRFNGQKERMLAAYNAGPHRVNRWQQIPGSDQVDVFIENIEFSETRDYVRKVLKNYYAYKLLNNNFQIDQSNLLLGFNE